MNRGLQLGVQHHFLDASGGRSPHCSEPVLAPKWVKKMSPRWNFQFCCKIVPPCCYVQSPLPDVPQRASFTVESPDRQYSFDC